MTLKDTILQEVLNLFKHEGFDELSESDIITRLNISQATYKEIFSNDEDLVKQVVLQDIENQKNRHKLFLKASNSGVADIMLLLQNTIEELKDVHPYYYEQLQKFPDAWAIMLNHINTYSNHLIADIINRGVLEGDFRRDINIQLVTKIILEQAKMMLNPQIFPSGSYNLNEVFRSVYLYYFRGLCTDKGAKLAEGFFS